MRFRRILSGTVFASLLLLVACGSNTTTTPPTPGTAPMSLVMHDQPPTGVTVLSFEISVTAATLNSSAGNVSLIGSKPVRVEVEHLQVEKAFLSAANVAAGTYDSVTLTFANPEMTILNNSGAAIGSCANGAKCELQPTLSPATVTYTGAPFPLTITANQPTGLLLDFNLNNSIQADLSVTPAVSFTQMAPPQHTGEMEEIDDIVGQITALDTTNNTVTLQDSSSGQSFIAKVDSNTEIEGFDHIGLANAFASFKTGQIVEVSLRLMSDGSFTAHKVELKVQEGMNQNQLDGAVVAIDSPTEFKMVLQEEAMDEGGMQVGNILTVTLQSGATFLIDTDGLSLPSTVSFQSTADVLVGQNVQVRIPTGMMGMSITTDQVTLHRSQVTATVLSTNGANFTVSNLSSLFTTATPPVTQIDVQTSSQTVFEGVADATGLAAGDRVSMRGLLFMTTGNPLVVADTIYKRPPGD